MKYYKFHNPVKSQSAVAAMALASSSLLSFSTNAAPLFSETFDSGVSSSSFLVSQIAGSTDVITFGFDYSTVGIPEAPSSPVGAAASRGLFLQANNGPGAINGINVTASSGGVAINFTEDIILSFDMWLNYALTFTSTTEQALFGINTDGAGVNSRTGSTQSGADGIWYHVASEGGYGGTSTTPNSRDVVNYIGNTVVGRLDNNDAPFPTLFPAPPAGLLGTPGNSWVRVTVEELGGNVRMTMNGTEIFNVVNTGPTSGSVFIGYQDPFSSSLADPATSFAVFDNVMVQIIPEPSAAALLLLGGLAVRVLRRRA